MLINLLSEFSLIYGKHHCISTCRLTNNVVCMVQFLFQIHSLFPLLSLGLVSQIFSPCRSYSSMVSNPIKIQVSSSTSSATTNPNSSAYVFTRNTYIFVIKHIKFSVLLSYSKVGNVELVRTMIVVTSRELGLLR